MFLFQCVEIDADGERCSRALFHSRDRQEALDNAIGLSRDLGYDEVWQLPTAGSVYPRRPCIVWNYPVGDDDPQPNHVADVREVTQPRATRADTLEPVKVEPTADDCEPEPDGCSLTPAIIGAIECLGRAQSEVAAGELRLARAKRDQAMALAHLQDLYEVTS